MGVKITDLGTAALPLTGTEQLELAVSDQESRRVSVDDLLNSGGLDATFVTISANVGLVNERILTAGANINIVDGGAGNAVTISVTGLTDTLAALTDTDLTGQADNDLLYRSGGLWIDTAGLLTWDGAQLLLPQNNDATAPTIALGDGDSGFYEQLDDQINVALAGVSAYTFHPLIFQGNTLGAPGLQNSAGSATDPNILVNRSDGNSGFSQPYGSNSVGVVCFGQVGTTWDGKNTFGVVQQHETQAGLTADVGSSQGDGLLESSYNIFSTVANVGDAATMPNLPPLGTVIYVKNDGVNSMDVFPDTGDNFVGSAVNIAVAVAPGESKTWVCSVANATWTELIVGGGAFDTAADYVMSGSWEMTNALGFELGPSCELRLRNNADNSHTFIQNLGTALQFGVAGADFGSQVFEIGSSFLKVQVNRSIFFDEKAAQGTPVLGDGEFWVRDDNPNVPMFTDDLGTDFVLNAAGAIPDPLVIGSVNATENAAISLANNVAALNIGGTASPGTGPIMEINAQFLQTKSSKFGVSTFFINNLGGDVQAGNINGASVHVDAGVAVLLRHAASGTVVAQTTTAAAGGFLANNLATGAGLERVLTTADLGGTFTGSLAVDQIAFGSGVDAITGNANLTWNDVILTIGSTGQSAATGVLCQNDAGGIRLMVVNASGIGQINQFSAAGAVEDTWMLFNRNAGVTLNANGVSGFGSHDRTVAGNLTGGFIVDSVANSFPIGFNVIPGRTITASQTMDEDFIGRLWEKTSGGAAIITLPVDANIPNGATIMVANIDTEALSVNTSGTTLQWLDGSGATVTGNRTVAGLGSIVTIRKRNSTNFQIWGNGIT